MINRYEYLCAIVLNGPQDASKTNGTNGTRETSKLSATITDLAPFTNYTCSVKAATINGTGPAEDIVATTAEDGM